MYFYDIVPILTESSVDDHGCLKVNEFLQVEGQEDVFAMGDCVNTDEPKVAYLGEVQAATVFHNLGQKAREQPMRKHTLGELSRQTRHVDPMLG